MEIGLGALMAEFLQVTTSLVLILVVVEDGLGDTQFQFDQFVIAGLNPCCSGRWSRSCGAVTLLIKFLSVLILVVVEDGPSV